MFNKCCELLAKEKIKIAFFESASAGYLAYRFSLSPYSGDILIGRANSNMRCDSFKSHMIINKLSKFL